MQCLVVAVFITHLHCLYSPFLSSGQTHHLFDQQRLRVGLPLLLFFLPALLLFQRFISPGISGISFLYSHLCIFMIAHPWISGDALCRFLWDIHLPSKQQRS